MKAHEGEATEPDTEPHAINITSPLIKELLAEMAVKVVVKSVSDFTAVELAVPSPISDTNVPELTF